MLPHQGQGRLPPGRAWVQLFQLQGQAFRQISGRHAGRVETLHTLQHGNQFVRLHLQLRTEAAAQIRHRDIEHSVWVHRVDDGQGDQAIPRRHGREVQLPAQVIAQGLLAAIAFGRIKCLVRRPVRTSRRGKDVVPIAVHRQLFGNGLGRLGVQIQRCARFLPVPVPILATGAFSVLLQGRGSARLQRRILRPLLFLLFQHGIGFQGLLKLLAQFQRGKLQEPHGLMQLGRQMHLLTQPWGQGLPHRLHPPLARGIPVIPITAESPRPNRHDARCRWP